MAEQMRDTVVAEFRWEVRTYDRDGVLMERINSAGGDLTIDLQRLQQIHPRAIDVLRIREVQVPQQQAVDGGRR